MSGISRFLKVVAGFILVIGISPGLAVADVDFDYNASGLTINRAKGRTIVGMTRDSSKTWSLFLDRSGKAYFKFSSGREATATWRKRSKNIICFKGLIKDDLSKDICKLATPRGRGTDWMTVEVFEKDGKLRYRKAVKDEHRGTSQLVYSFAGREVVNQNSYVSDLTKWGGHIVVGRTLKDKEAWVANFRLDGSFVFVFGSGQRLFGSYTTTSKKICMKFPSKPSSNGCRAPKVKDGKIVWASAENGSYISEIVFMKKISIEGPQLWKTLSKNHYRQIISDDYATLIAGINTDDKQIEFWDSATLSLIGFVAGEARDIAFSRLGNMLAIGQKSSLRVVDARLGIELVKIDIEGEGFEFREVVFSPDSKQILVGDDQGHVSVYSVSSGELIRRVQLHSSPINDIDVSVHGVVLTGDTVGQIKLHRLGDFTPLDQVEPTAEKVTRVEFSLKGDQAVISSVWGELRLLNFDGETLLEDKPFKVGAGPFGLSIRSDGKEVVLSSAENTSFYSLPEFELLAEIPREKADRGYSNAYVSAKGGVAIAFTTGAARVWVRNVAELGYLNRPQPEAMANYRTRKKTMNQAQGAARAIYTKLQNKAGGYFFAGECVEYDALVASLKPQHQQQDCTGAIVRRAEEKAKRVAAQALAEEKRQLEQNMNAAFTELKCEEGQRFANDLGQPEHPGIAKCFAKVAYEVDQQRFADAKSTGNCAVVRELQNKFSDPTAGAECEHGQAMAAPTARKMYFAAVKYESAKDRTRARALYARLMERFPEDDLAIDSANRMMALNDLDAMEQNQAANDAALKAAQQAIVQANNDRDVAKREAAAAAAKAAALRASQAAARKQQAAAKARAKPKYPVGSRVCSTFSGGKNGFCGYITQILGNSVRIENYKVFCGKAGIFGICTNLAAGSCTGNTNLYVSETYKNPKSLILKSYCLD